MSKISALKTIDVQKWATVTLLDAFGIDIDPEDGHIYFADAPDISMDINDRVLRVELGKAIKGIDYATFNPLCRVEHAQYLMTLAIYAQVIDQMMDPEEAKLADFSIETEVEMVDEFGKPVIIPINVAYITRGDVKDKKGPEGVGRHEDQACAIVFAILDWMNKCGYLPEQTMCDVMQACKDGWEEVNRVKELPGKERRKVVRERKNALIAPEEEDDSDDYLEGEYEPYEEEDENDVYFEDDETSNITFDDSDFIEDYNPTGDNEWNDSDFEFSEMRELFGNSIKFFENEPVVEEDNEPVMNNNFINPYQQTGYVPDANGQSFDDIDFNEHVTIDEIPLQRPANGNDPAWMGMCGQQPVQQQNFPNFNDMTPVGIIPQQNYPNQTVAKELPDLKLEDILTESELKKIKEREESEKKNKPEFIEDASESLNYSRINMNNFAFGCGGGRYIP